MDVEQLIQNFAALGPWEERYRYLIDLGRKLPPLRDDERVDANQVRGCMSQVWLVAEERPGPPRTLSFRGDSDAHIVKGLIALLLRLYDGQTPEVIHALDVQSVFERLGLENQITVNRRNGFYAMVERIRTIASRRVAESAH